ncbi:T-cell surface antigen CD2 isoform X2 [Ailuropoda melanoleuca]|uniref:T-cell surface antigen CD2 isoform X2 n=1 Tax=Ailuropoda melanoleuca TaxID=9646 RepID=UPI0014942A09|nr:T-cell surface antigen CD2 isoform X2 [Ailuropoda melanoleuca]
MSLTCQILASFLLIFIVSTKGAAPENNVVWGTLGHDFDLNISGFQMNDNIDDIRWEKDKTLIARVKNGKLKDLKDERYNVSTNGALKIKHLKTEDSDTYRVVIYKIDGKNVLDKTFQLKIQEEISTLDMFWNCSNRNLTCEIKNGTNPELILYLDGTVLGRAVSKTISQKIAAKKWTTKRSMSFNCTARNEVSEQSRGVTINCSDEELEIRTRRATAKERHRKPRQGPGPAPQNPAVSQPPPPPSHRPQAHCHRPPPPSHRVQHHPQKKSPPPSGAQVHQQKGPPLPRPRVQPKPPHGATENS